MRASWVLPLCLLCTPALAASAEYDRCVAAIDNAALTSSQRLDCATKDMDRADAALNATYREVIERLPAQRQTALREAERRWIDQRRNRCAPERQEANPSRDLNRMLCLVRETDARTEALRSER